MIGFIVNHPICSLILALVGYLVYKFVIKMYIMRSQLPPGPFPLPLIGNILSFRGIQKNSAVILSHLIEEHGDPATFFAGPSPMVVLSSPETIRENLIDNPHDFQNRAILELNDLFMQGEQDIINGQYNELWKLHKKIAARAIKRIVDSEHLSAHVNKTVRDLEELLLAESGPVTLADYTASITYSVLMHFCYGMSVSFGDEMYQKRLEIRKRQAEMFGSGMQLLMFLPGNYYIFKYCTFIKSIKELNDMSCYFDKFGKNALQEHKDKFDPENPVKDIMDAVLMEQHEMRKAGEPFEKMKDVHVNLLCTDIFEAGIETTSVTMQWFFLEMVLNPEIQDKCHKQIDEVMGTRAPTLTDRKHLPFVEACIVETLRMHPPAPFGVPTTPSNKDALLSKTYRLPEHTMIATNLLSLHYNEKYFENAKVFNPDRFVGPGGVLKPPAWLPFGCGKRVCLGEQLAKNDMFLIITGLLQNLKFNKVPGQEYDLEPDIMENNYVPRKRYQFDVEKR